MRSAISPNDDGDGEKKACRKRAVNDVVITSSGKERTIVDNLGVVTTYTYDEKDRLTQDASTGPDAHTYNYTFDSRDNLLTTNESGTLTTMVYDAASRLVTSTAGTVVTTMTYDPNGNVTQVNAGGTITTMTYNFENQMRTHVSGGVTKRSLYDISGYKRAELNDWTFERLYYFEGPSVIAESTDAASSFTIPSCYYLLDGLLIYGRVDGAMATSADAKEYIVDYLGSVRGYTLGDKASIRQNPTRFRPFGSNLSGTPTLPHAWTGNTGSRRTGLTFAEQYNRARHYSTVLRQWTTVDPLWPMLHAYGYVLGRPTVLIDWSGGAPGWPYGAPAGAPVPGSPVPPPNPVWPPAGGPPTGGSGGGKPGYCWPPPLRPGPVPSCTKAWNDYIYRSCNCGYLSGEECHSLANTYYDVCGKGKPGPGLFGPPSGGGQIAPRPKPWELPPDPNREPCFDAPTPQDIARRDWLENWRERFNSCIEMMTSGKKGLNDGAFGGFAAVAICRQCCKGEPPDCDKMCRAAAIVAGFQFVDSLGEPKPVHSTPPRDLTLPTGVR